MSTEYYLHALPCPSCHRYTEIQIGLSAAGWVFMWRGWRDAEQSPAGRPLDTPGRWRAYLTETTQNGAVIKDEYGHEWSLDAFIAKVAVKRMARGDKLPLRHSELNDLGGAEPIAVHVDGDDFAFRDIG